MKGQTQALTAVLITSVTIGAIATAYVWGTPLLEKRQSKAQLEKVERQVFDLHNSIISVARSGKGTTSKTTLEIENGRLRIDENLDYIQIFTNAESAPYPPGSWTLIKGKSLQNLSIGSGSYGLKSQDLPGVVAVKAAAGAGRSVVTYKVEFRNLYVTDPAGNSLSKIDIQTSGRQSATGETTLIISNEGVARDRVKVSTGEKIPRTKTVVEIDIQ
ncbi:MAG: hypothetical protein ABEI58_00820 [Candidatus Nanohaloarchaea archaeon]